MAIVYALETGSFMSTRKHPLKGGPYRTRQGQPFDSSHELVQVHPEQFADAPPVVVGAEVERATARPGEKRTTRRG